MTVNLRGLGPRATLVLMNGRRQTVDGNAGLDGVVAVDINNIAPSIMIERVEVLTDGASALYGSDAVAGVVNLITRNNFEGIELKTEMQSIDEIGSNDFTVGALFGTQSDDTSIVAGFEWSHQERMNSEERYSEARLAAAGLPSAFANPGSFRDVATPPSAEFPDPLCGQLASGLAAGFIVPQLNGSSQCQMSLSLGRAIVPDAEHLNGLAVVTHDLSEAVTAQVEMGFARARYAYDFGYGLPILPPFPVMPGENPGVAAAGLPTTTDYFVRYRIRSPIGDPPTDTLAEQDTFRVAGSLFGDFGDSVWSWNTTVTFSQNESLGIGGDTIRQRFNDAISGLGGPNCNPGPATQPGVGDCLWLNPFANRFLAQQGDANYNDPILADWVFARSNTDGRAELETLDFVVTGAIGEMAGGETGLAVGVQTRSQEFFVDYDPLTEDGGYAFNTTPQQDYGGIRDTDALFAEVVMYPTDSVEIQFAVRYEDYGSVDSTDPKVGLLWTPREGLFFRATAGTSFRQPGETQSFGTASQGSTTQAIGGAVINARGLLLGNTSLEPEDSENFTLGMTWDITDNFTMDLNYWSIDFNNLIVTEDGQVILNNDIADGFIDDPRITLFPGAPNEVCEVTGTPAGGPTCVTGDDIALFTLSYINQDFQNTAGLDFNFDWRFSGAGSEWGVGLTGTYVDKFDLTSEGQVFDGVGSYNGANFGYAMPELTANVRLDWMRGNHHARATLHHISKLDEDLPARPLTEEKTFETLDLLYDYTLPSGNSTVTVGIINATDEDDPIRQGDLRTTESFVYDLRGRMYRIGVNWGF
jgi:outer membrane receptor protein involved in Fe transport